MLEQEILESIYEAIRTVNPLLSARSKLECDPGTCLFGPSSALDSMQLVNLLIEAETAVSERLGQTITLTDERALSQNRSPFESVRSLQQYILSTARAGNEST